MKDFLIIGQGAAGSFLAWELIKRDKGVVIVDDAHARSSSIVSAGIINPVTGKRFAIMDGFDDLYDSAMDTYDELKQKFDQNFFESISILRIFQDAEERDHWQRKVDQNVGQEYGKGINPPGFVHTGLKDPLGSVTIQSAGFCQSKRLLTTLKEYFINEKILANHTFSYDDITIVEKGIRYGGETFGAVIFCEGYMSQWNPFFKDIPYNSVKGEILNVSIKDAVLPPMIINKGKWVAPIDSKQWLAGSSYIWDDLDCKPTKEARDLIINGLAQSFDYKVEVKDHKAGVRPVIDDQTVIAGYHPSFPNIGIFNGLGSKGFLAAPFFAKHLADYLSGKEELHEAIDVGRFDKELMNKSI